jgi:alkanesulfonate monooxygenase SsuD/methylene tetrahydromethanopterin reductase-like flavin-dependent oxidoreductase (luciferase family)
MRFGLFIPQGWRHDLVGIEPAQQWGVMAGLARRADENDQWESLWVYDHFHTLLHPTQEATHEAWTLMAAYAAVTSRIRLGSDVHVHGLPQPPAYLAKVATTVDIVSGGRVEMGIGAGLVRARVARLRLRVPAAEASDSAGCARAWRSSDRCGRPAPATLDGTHYQVAGALNCARAPLQGTSIEDQPGERHTDVDRRWRARRSRSA